MPRLRRERDGNNGACPDAATVLAVIEGEAEEWLRDAYAQHLAQCSACSELDSRLRNFDRPVLVKDDAEWRQTEKRLDNWMSALLDSRAASPRLLEPRAGRAGFWEFLWRPGLAWRISWALGLVALFAIGAAVSVRWGRPSDLARVATGSTPVMGRPLQLPPKTASPKGQAAKKAEQQPPPVAAPSNQSSTIYLDEPSSAQKTPKTIPRANAPVKPEEPPVVARKASPPESQQQAALAPPVTRTTPGAALTTRRGAAATSLRAAPTEPATSLLPPTEPAMENVAIGRPFSQAIEAQVPPPAANLPESLRLAAGARLWLALDSFSFQADNVVVFHGSLLLPLNSAGSTALDHGTQVSGFVTSAQGQSSVLLSEIVIRGTHYKLKNQAGGGNARAAGSGGAVQFDSGKVLEMWVSSDSIYERSTAESSQ